MYLSHWRLVLEETNESRMGFITIAETNTFVAAEQRSVASLETTNNETKSEMESLLPWLAWLAWLAGLVVSASLAGSHGWLDWLTWLSLHSNDCIAKIC